MTNDEVVNSLRLYMKEKELTQGDLARKLEIGETQLNRWLNGKNKIGRVWLSMLKVKKVLK